MKALPRLLMLFVLGTVPVAAMAQPSNDECADRVAVAVGGVGSGTTVGATLDTAATCPTDGEPSGGNTQVTAPGVWYAVMGNGSQLQATTCPSTDTEANATYDTKISVYCPDCETLSCVKANDDQSGCSTSFRSTVVWCSEPGVEYQVLVHGFGTATGSFALAVNDLGACTEEPADCGPLVEHHLATPAIRSAFGRDVFCKATNVTGSPITLDELTIYKTNGAVATTMTDVTIPPHGVQSIRGDFSSHENYHCEARYRAPAVAYDSDWAEPGYDHGEGVLLRTDVLQNNNTLAGASGDEPERKGPVIIEGFTADGIWLATPAIRSAFGRDLFCTATNTTDWTLTLDRVTIYSTGGAVAATATNVSIPPHGVSSLRGDFSSHQEYHCEAEYGGDDFAPQSEIYGVSDVLLRVEVIANNNALSGADD